MGGGVGVDALGQQAREHGPRAVDAREAAAQDPEDEDAYCDVHEDGDEGADERGGGGRVGAVERLAEGAAGGVVAGGADPGVIILADVLFRGLVEGGGRSVRPLKMGPQAGNGKGRGGRATYQSSRLERREQAHRPIRVGVSSSSGTFTVGVLGLLAKIGTTADFRYGGSDVGRSGRKFRACW